MGTDLSTLQQTAVREVARLALIVDSLGDDLLRNGVLTAKGQNRAALSAYVIALDRLDKLMSRDRDGAPAEGRALAGGLPRRTGAIVMSVLEMMADPQLMGRWFAGPTWRRWMVFLAAIHGLPREQLKPWGVSPDQALDCVQPPQRPDGVADGALSAAGSHQGPAGRVLAGHDGGCGL